jgi:polar amino acid transport system permease protein
MNYTFQFGVALESLPALLKASVLTVELSFFAFWGGALIGLAGAAAKTFGGSVVRHLAQAYVVFFTNTPALIQIYILYY